MRVLEAPLEGTASEIYFEGHAVFRQIALVPASERPAQPASPLLSEKTRPAELKWSGSLAEGSRLS